MRASAMKAGKRILVPAVVVVGLLALNVVLRLLGRGGPELVRIETPPEIDASAIEKYMDVEKTKIGPERQMVSLLGRAKEDLGEAMWLEVDRMDGERLVDTVRASVRIVGSGRLPEGYVIRDGQGGPPPYDPRILAGDPVRFSVDAVTAEGPIRKLVIRPVQPAASAPSSQPAASAPSPD